MNLLLKKGGPPGAEYCCTDRGWMTEEIFIQYLRHFKKVVKPSLEDPVLLIMDNHSTHCTLEAYEFCKANGIILLTIPPHTSHRLQPLDVTFYGPLKTAYNTECSKYLKSHPHEKITPFEVAELFNNAYMRVATLEKAAKGFQVTGIWPYNPDIFIEEDFAAADLHNPFDEPQQYTETQHRDLPPENELTSRIHSTPTPQPTLDDQFPVVEVTKESNNNMEISFEKNSPLPGPSQPRRQSIKRKTKQTSQIITATPNKDVLIEKANKKLAKKTTRKGAKEVKKRIFLDDDDEEDSGEMKRARLPRNVGTRRYKDSSSDDDEESNDDENEDQNVIGDDLCLLCGEFGKNREIWLRCVMCGNWAHKACANVENKIFICDYCA
ncbi:uncharacterized protein LOC111691596 [Anoplophora glabripennis]|uniref:uncharacterized protein LOC111691596 n=1 Tax=Anoplophora glabripennis TaxID=217634 RepID=UPI000C7731A5|nr:uncharacterized protein LOC111691596 [Anoplophora glabripennis]